MHKRSFGWIAREIHNAIKQLKVPTYEHVSVGGVVLDKVRSCRINFFVIADMYSCAR
jgi:hypothetical protein